MANNADVAMVNEIFVAFHLNNKKWFDPQAQQVLKQKSKSIGLQETATQSEKAERMAGAFRQWAKANGYSGTVRRVWWTARPGVLSRAVGREVDSRKNPTDVLVQFTSGPAKGFLGLSAKTTQGNTDIGFKNPGMGTVEATLNIDLTSIVSDNVNLIVSKFKLPENTQDRKKAIRKSKTVQAKTQEIGSKTLMKIRDVMFRKLKTLDQKALKNYVLNNWMDASADLYPPYVKVTGLGNKPPFGTKVDDPLKNDKLTAVLKGPIALTSNGNESIVVAAAGKPLFRMRAKFESEKLASSVKFSGDPIN